MARLPFDPESTRAAREARAGGASGDDAPLEVSHLSRRLADAVKAGVPGRVRVVGEVGNARRRTHLYFSIRDEHASLDCVQWASVARRSAVEPAPGDRVIVTGSVEFYPPQGRVTLIADSITPAGIGDFDRRLRELVERARSLGWLEPGAKRTLPAFPRRVAVITSRTGAALQDVIDTARRRCPAVGLAVVDSVVQGPRAAGDVAAALAWTGAHAEAIGVDAVILTRGGGSKEDLWAFNDFAIAEAIHACPVPVVAAIGHETDTTLAELVADERCATPTQAAMRLVPERDALARQVSSVSARLAAAVRTVVATGAHRVRSAAARPALARPADEIVRRRRDRLATVRLELSRATASVLAARRRRLERARVRIDTHRPTAVQERRRVRLAVLESRLRGAVGDRVRITAQERLRAAGDALGRAIRADLNERRASLDAMARELDAIGPAAVLRRGYSVTLDAHGSVVRRADALAPGQRIRVRFADGSVESEVRTDADGRSLPGSSGRTGGGGGPRRRRGRINPDPDQMDLFGGGG